ncbi:MAG TPA: PucR family transcriptional regulator [Nocardioidaceae bacterium]|nr:PucR family transcriptional regulator [Nocardioidaceae bacterium]
MPTLRMLATALGSDLELVGTATALDREVTGVHVSELIDPTGYLFGGELLLTTGMSLSGHGGQARAYVKRLVRQDVAALGLGVGPVHEAMPGALVRACDAEGLPLFSIPDPTPFLAVTRAYWGQLVSAGRADLSASLDVHRELIRALRQRDPVEAIIRILAEASHGWAARLGVRGEPRDVWPTSRRPVARRLAAEIERLRGAGPHASATFPLDSDDVMVQPLAQGSRLLGYVAIGAPRRQEFPDRQQVLAACALLTMQLSQHAQGTMQDRTERACILRLALDGHLDAARALSDSLEHERLPSAVRLIAVGPEAQLSPADLPDRWESSGRLWTLVDGEVVWVMSDSELAAGLLAHLRGLAESSLPDLRAVSSPAVPPSSLPGQRLALRDRYDRQAAGAVVDADGGSPADRAAGQVEALVGYRRSDLVAAVAAYLRHRGNWERGAERLGVHRNTLRHRIAAARQVADVDLDDPDQASHLWLALRQRGLAR